MNPRSEERPHANPLLASLVKSSGSLVPVPGSCVPGLGVSNSGPPSAEGRRSRGTVRAQSFQAPGTAWALHRGSGTAAPWGDISQECLGVAVKWSWAGAVGRRRLTGLTSVV